MGVKKNTRTGEIIEVETESWTESPTKSPAPDRPGDAVRPGRSLRPSLTATRRNPAAGAGPRRRRSRPRRSG